jgi:glycosyltransferase involved in cell wall biosynthesis
LREELNIPKDAPVVGIVAALRPEKRHDLFLRSAQIIRSKMPKARFLIVGDGPQREELERLAGELSLDDCVHFLGTREDIPQVLSLMDVFMLTSEMEANPVSIIEAMATEKPVVAPKVGSVPETVDHGKTGFLFAAGDADAAAARTIELLSRPELAAKMGRFARERVIAHWSVERMVDGYQDMIAQIYTQKVSKKKTGAKQSSSHSDGLEVKSR